MADLVTDTGIFFPDTTSLSFLDFEDKSDIIRPNLFTDRCFGSELTFYVTRGYKKYKRTYLRFSAVLGSVGGILNLFKMAISFFFSYYLDVSYATFLQEKLLILNKEIETDVESRMSQTSNIDAFYKDSKSKDLGRDKNNFNDLKEEFSSNDMKHDMKEVELEVVSQNKSFYSSSNSININRIDSNNDIVVNKEIHKIINYKKHKLEEVKLSSLDRFYFSNFYFCYRFMSRNENNQLKFKL